MEAAARDDDDDPVARELDVFLSHALANSSYLLQFPLQNAQSDAADLLGTTTECRMKPHRDLLEVDLALDTDCSNYDPDSKLVAPTRTLKANVVPSKANYCVGAVRGNELHLTPLHAALQMRPSFQLVDDLDEKDKEASGVPKDDFGPKSGAGAKKKDDSDKPDVYKVTIKRAETERTIERRQKSHKFLEQEEKKEPWVSVDLNNLGTDPSLADKKRLYAADTAGASLPEPLSKLEYLDLLSPPLEGDKDCATAAADSALMNRGTRQEDLSMHALRGMPLEQQVSALLHHHGVVRLDRLVAILDTAPDQEDAVIAELEREATVIQGCWVVNSAIVCVDENAKMLPYREKLCMSLVQDKYVSQTLFGDVTELNHLAVAKLFETLTVKEPGHGCRLKVLADIAFCTKHAEIVERHNAAWVARVDEINAPFDDSTASVAFSAQKEQEQQKAQAQEDRPQPAAAAAAAAPVRGTTGDGGESSGRHERTVRSLLERHGVATLRFLEHHLQEDGATSAEASATISSLCVQLAGDDDGGYCLAAQGSEGVDKYRRVVLGLFGERDKLRKKDINEAAQTALGEEVPTQLYTKICKELATSTGGQWTRKVPVNLE